MNVSSFSSIRHFAFVSAALLLSTTAVAQFPSDSDEAPNLFESTLFDAELFQDEAPVFSAETEASNTAADLESPLPAQSEPVSEPMRQESKQAPAPLVRKPLPDEPVGVLVDDIPSSSDFTVSKPTAAELRQARAQMRQQQRLERMERNLWFGYEPLRPNWNAIPMMHSRYAYRTTHFVPVYYYPAR